EGYHLSLAIEILGGLRERIIPGTPEEYKNDRHVSNNSEHIHHLAGQMNSKELELNVETPVVQELESNVKIINEDLSTNLNPFNVDRIRKLKGYDFKTEVPR
ncbi:128_t:CDS:2, partial [Funneliformis geosporum]